MDKTALAAECLAAVTGLYPSDPVARSQIREAVGVPKETERAVKAFLAEESPAKQVKIPTISYLRTWDKLNETQRESELTAIIGDPEIGAAYLSKLDDARRFLAERWRPTILKTIVGPKILAPSTSEESRCQCLYAATNDPRLIIGRLASNTILAEEMNAIRIVFPEFYAMASDMIRAELFRLSLRRKSYEPKFWQETAIALFFGEPISGGAETVNADTIPPESEAPPEFEIATKREKGDALTKADRVESGAPA